MKTALLTRLAALGFRERRAIFSWWVTGFCLTAALFITVTSSSQVAEKAVTSFLDLAGTVVAVYIGGSIIDRSALLERLGGRFAPKPPEQTPDK